MIRFLAGGWKVRGEPAVIEGQVAPTADVNSQGDPGLDVHPSGFGFGDGGSVHVVGQLDGGHEYQSGTSGRQT